MLLPAEITVLGASYPGPPYPAMAGLVPPAVIFTVLPACALSRPCITIREPSSSVRFREARMSKSTLGFPIADDPSFDCEGLSAAASDTLMV